MRNEINARKQNGCHAPLIGDYSSTRNRLTRKCATLHLSGTVDKHKIIISRNRSWKMSNQITRLLRILRSTKVGIYEANILFLGAVPVLLF